MLKRKIDHYVKRYYETTRNALLITGARQIGKTYSIRQFGKSFKSFVEINFIDNPSTNPDAKAPTYCFALPSFPVVTKFVIPVAATLNTPPTNPPNKICAKCPVGSSYINGLL